MAEVVDFLTPLPPYMSAQDRSVLEALARKIFSTWGQSKVIEDGNKEIREKEDRDTTCKLLGIRKQWDALVAREVIKAHGREEVKPTGAPTARPPPLPKDLFSCKGHQDS
eukprot:5207136-Lingulodinium_polyedra.AAC.1